MNFALVPNVLLLLKGCREGETFYHAPVNLGFQPIKLLALEPFEVEYQCCPDSIEQQVCVFSGGYALAYIGSVNIDIQNFVAAVCPDFIRREPGGAILSVCKILTGIPSVCAVRLDAFQKRPIIRGKRIILVPHRIKSAKGNFQQILVLFHYA